MTAAGKLSASDEGRSIALLIPGGRAEGVITSVRHENGYTHIRSIVQTARHRLHTACSVRSDEEVSVQ